MYIYLPLLTYFHTLWRQLNVIDCRLCRIIHHFFIPKIMASVSIIILSGNNDFNRFLLILRIHHLKSPYTNKYIFFHLFLLILLNVDFACHGYIIRQNGIGKFLEFICKVTDIKAVWKLCLLLSCTQKIHFRQKAL